MQWKKGNTIVDGGIRDIVVRVFDGHMLKRDELILLLRVPGHSPEAGLIMASADALSREVSNGIAEVHAQVGINLSPCPQNCDFCAFAARNRVFQESFEIPIEDIVKVSLKAEREGANAVLLMATADYPLGRFMEVSYEVRSKLKPATVMIANVGDFDSLEASRLKDVGYAGVYHALRMGEGVVTRIPPDRRLHTFRAASEAGLLLGTCVEPLGPEHTVEEIVDKIIIHRDAHPCYSGAARRIPVRGSALERHGMISEYRMALIVSVVRLAMGREVVGNCTHEPNVLGAASGANLFWAEAGSNPRDTEAETSRGRGCTVERCIELFREADWDILTGPSVIYQAKIGSDSRHECAENPGHARHLPGGRLR